MRLVLASNSPRRKDLLELLGLSFEVYPSEFNELPTSGLSPLAQVRHFALEKARDVAQVRPQDVVLGSDTVIELDGRLLGKPQDLSNARAMLTRLAGRGHYVHTAVALCHLERGIGVVDVATTLVVMKADVESAYDRYIGSQESLGKAGAYAIQGLGGSLVERIDGDYTTVVGLPLKLTAHLLQSVGYPIPVNVDDLYHCKPYANWSRFVP